VMAGYSTTMVTVGPRAVGPFGARAWRATHTLTLIEKHRRCWISSTAGYGVDEAERTPAFYFPPMLNAGEELLLSVAATVVQPEDFMTMLVEYGLGVKSEPDGAPDRIDFDPDGLDLPEVAYLDLIGTAIETVPGVARLAITRLEPSSQFGDEDINWLRLMGFDIDEFALVAHA
jgi:hypothetical protein